jgi:hypothetical protein
MSRRLLVAAFLVIGSFVGFSNAHADERADNSTAILSQANLSALMQPVQLADAAQFPVQISAPRPKVSVDGKASAAKIGMGAVYVSTALMHVLDVDSTLKAMKRGAIESNPLMKGVVKNRAAFIATKAAIATASIYATSRMAKNNKLHAIIASTAINSAYLMIVKNNYSIANR